MSKILMKEGWIILDAIYSNGVVAYKFSEYEPDFLEDEVYDGRTKQFVPGSHRRIMYFDADDVNLENTP